MLQKRFDHDQDESADQGGQTGTMVAAETLRSAAASGPKPAKVNDEEKMSLFWRVFGGTILSITALVIITLYNNITSTLTDLRADIAREREARGGFAKKEDMDARVKTQYDRIRVVEAYKADIETVKERVNANAVAVEGVRKDIGASVDALRKDSAGLEIVKERVAAVEALRKDVAGLDTVKDKLATVCTELKTAKDDVQKVQQELERNKASDLERKTYRDAQSKSIDETLKLLHKDLQDCREKLARMEGGKQQPAVGPPPPPKPADKDAPVGSKPND